MNTTTLFTKSVLQIALLAMLVSLAGCGSDDKEPTQICLVLLIIPVVCSVGTPSPPSLEPPPPPPAPPPSNSDGESNTSGGNNTGPRTLTMARVAEFEPNNTLDNANVVQFRIAPIEHSVGIDINGSVQETDDQSDFFIFTPNRSDRHGIYLCAETCGAFLEDDAVYIMLYDQHQTTIVSTPVGTVAEQMVTAELTAGLAYYVEVRGVKTGSTPYPYQLIIVD